jgi:hypothetical protein
MANMKIFKSFLHRFLERRLHRQDLRLRQVAVWAYGLEHLVGAGYLMSSRPIQQPQHARCVGSCCRCCRETFGEVRRQQSIGLTCQAHRFGLPPIAICVVRDATGKSFVAFDVAPSLADDLEEELPDLNGDQQLAVAVVFMGAHLRVVNPFLTCKLGIHNHFPQLGSESLDARLVALLEFLELLINNTSERGSELRRFGLHRGSHSDKSLLNRGGLANNREAESWKAYKRLRQDCYGCYSIAIGWVMRGIAVMNVYICRLDHARSRSDECLHMNDRESMNVYVCIQLLRSAKVRESHGEHSYTTIHPACMRGEWWAGVSPRVRQEFCDVLVKVRGVAISDLTRTLLPAQVPTVSWRSSVLKQQIIGKRSRFAAMIRLEKLAINRKQKTIMGVRGDDSPGKISDESQTKNYNGVGSAINRTPQWIQRVRAEHGGSYNCNIYICE